MLSTCLMLVTILTWSFSGSNPVCESNMRPDGYIGPTTCQLTQEEMVFTCTVSFNGEPPQMTWKISNGWQPFYKSMCKIENSRITCSLNLRADSKYDGSIFNCQLSNSSVNCSTGIIKIHYFESQSVEGKPPLMVKNVGDKVSCSVKSNQILKFKWTFLQDNQYVTEQEKQELSLPRPGFYRCGVEYNISNVVCVADGSEVNVLTPNTTDCEPAECSHVNVLTPNTTDCEPAECSHEDKTAIICLAIFLGISLLGIIALIVVFVVNFRKWTRDRYTTDTEMEG